MDYVSYVIAIEELSRVCASHGVIASVNNSLVCYPILTYGTEAQKQKYLVPLARASGSAPTASPSRTPAATPPTSRRPRRSTATTTS